MPGHLAIGGWAALISRAYFNCKTPPTFAASDKRSEVKLFEVCRIYQQLVNQQSIRKSFHPSIYQLLYNSIHVQTNLWSKSKLPKTLKLAMSSPCKSDKRLAIKHPTGAISARRIVTIPSLLEALKNLFFLTQAVKKDQFFERWGGCPVTVVSCFFFENKDVPVYCIMGN